MIYKDSKGIDHVHKTIASTITADRLKEFSEKRVLFGHQSVGANIIDGIKDVFADFRLDVPRVLNAEQNLDVQGGYLLDITLGENRDPLGKIDAFDKLVRSGYHERIDVALIKMCYVDVSPKTDVDGLFKAYKETTSRLSKDFPSVRFVKATVPLTVPQGWQQWLMSKFAGNVYDPEAAVRREQFNVHVRETFPQSDVVDIAAVESTLPDGSRMEGTASAGSSYYSLVPEYASDSGHLNELGRRLAAASFIARILAAEPDN